jgi:acetyl-CoA acyltransferase 2
MAATRVYIVAAKRTPFGAFGGTLKNFSPTQLAAHAAKAALAEAKLAPSAVDTCIVGNVSQTNSDTVYLSRHVALEAGLNVATPCLTVNRLCGSGFQSIVSVVQEMLTDPSVKVLVFFILYMFF